MELYETTRPGIQNYLWRFSSKKIFKEVASFKLQASSLTVTEGYYRINLERYNMEKEINGHLYITNDNLKRIADAIEEILRIVKKDMEPRTKKEKN